MIAAPDTINTNKENKKVNKITYILYKKILPFAILLAAIPIRSII
jgi:hypothetical protein